jgi:predicted DNA-binding transcriptional regulator YafY
MDIKRGTRPDDATLIGYCHLRGEMRTFKMDRIVGFEKV